MNNLGLYHKVLRQLGEWRPRERITRKRDLAWLIVGLQQSGEIHLSKIVRTWSLGGKLPSLVNRLNRFLNNAKLIPWRWYSPLAQALIEVFAGQDLRLIVDCTKVGSAHRCTPLARGANPYGWVRVTEKHQAGWYWLVIHWAKEEPQPWYLPAN